MPAIQFLHNLFYVSNWHMARYQLCIIIIIIIIAIYFENVSFLPHSMLKMFAQG